MSIKLERRAHAARCGFAFAAFALLITPFAHAAAPTISGTPVKTTTVGKAYSFTPTARDSDGNRLTFSIASKPAWASFSTSTGRLSGTPQAAHARAWSNIVISVSDGATRKSLPAFVILVRPASAATASNTAPKIAGSPVKSVTAGTAYSFQPTASDANKDKLTFAINNKPGWATFSTSTGKLSGTPWDHHIGTTPNIVIKVSDGKSTAALPSFSLTVKATSGGDSSDGRITVSWDPPTRTEGGAALTDLAGYRIRYGQSESSMSQVLRVTNPGVARYLIENLSAGTWFIGITAYTSSGLESELSEIVKATIR